MLGAIIGDISGSRFEWENLKSKEFELLTYRCHPTDDSNMTLAVAKALLQSQGEWSHLSELVITSMRELGRKYPRGYGGRFKQWLLSDDSQPYGSWGNGSAMRVSPCAWAAKSMDEALRLSDTVTEVTHNHTNKLLQNLVSLHCLPLLSPKTNQRRKTLISICFPLNVMSFIPQ